LEQPEEACSWRRQSLGKKREGAVLS
jgi:hypothetical protein